MTLREKSRRVEIIVVGTLLLLGIASTGLALPAFGVKAGICIADQEFESDIFGTLPTDRRIGVDIGGYIEWPWRRYSKILLELHYVQRGMKEEWLETTPQGTGLRTVKFNNRVDYLSVPILVKVGVPSGSYRPFLALGPRIDVLLYSDSPIWQEVYDDLEKVDVGADVAVGLDTRWISIETRYNYSLASTIGWARLSVTNKSFEVLLGRRI